jgi:hypothetical protein
MPARKADSVATAYLGLLAERGVEYLFGNAGTDFAPIIEAYAEAEQKGTALSRSSPRTSPRGHHGAWLRDVSRRFRRDGARQRRNGQYGLAAMNAARET